MESTDTRFDSESLSCQTQFCRPNFQEDHNYGATPAQRPIDEWAVNRRMNLEVMEAAREAASDSHPHVLTADEVASATAPVVDNARFIDEALQDAIPPEMR